MTELAAAYSDRDLQNLILTSPSSDLRSVLLSMSNRSGWEKKQIAGAFRSIHTYKSQKRKLDSTVYLCLDCGRAFTAEENPHGGCISHPGEMELDEDSETWWDYEESHFGPMDSDDNKSEYPEGFRWSCCDKTGDEEGCDKGKHVALHSVGHKKAKTEPVSTDNDGEDYEDVDTAYEGEENETEAGDVESNGSGARDEDKIVDGERA